jgi:hypothetical protein
MSPYISNCIAIHSEFIDYSNIRKSSCELRFEHEKRKTINIESTTVV